MARGQTSQKQVPLWSGAAQASGYWEFWKWVADVTASILNDQLLKHLIYVFLLKGTL